MSNQCTWPEVEVLLDDVGELLVGLVWGSIVHHGDGEGLRDADGVGDLREQSNGQIPEKLTGYKVFVQFREILSVKKISI